MSFERIAAIAAERLLFSMGVGTLLGVIAWLLLRVLPRKDSRTSFAVCFATLVMIAGLPVVGLMFRHAEQSGGAAVVTVSPRWAMYLFFAWASVAALGLLRVAIALWQVRQLRNRASTLELGSLNPELRAVVAEFGKFRSVELKVSRQLEVPTAIGFFKPAIVLPHWLLEETPAEELKYILLHELAHLKRRDDWTNLAQQIVKALLFFVPSVWWIERKLTLEREMACDDAVLEQAGSARSYAECLAHVAERSFLRRQLALAQAAVTRLKQLTVRLTKILDPNRTQAARAWRPAVPAVVIVAGLCVFSASQGPQLIGFADGQGANQVVAASSLGTNPAVAQTVGKAGLAEPKFVPASLTLSSQGTQHLPVRVKQQRKGSGKHEIRTLENLHAENKIPRGVMTMAALEPQQMPEYVTVRQQFVMVVMQGDGLQGWQVHVVEISVTKQKPQKQIPSKI